MNHRRGEKLGWILGWAGASLWIGVLAIVFLFQRKLFAAALGILLWLTAMATVFFFAPWRFPDTRYRRLMAGPYAVLCIGIVWAIWAFDAFSSFKWSILWWLPLLLLPILNVGKRTWNQS
ncbi:MAG: phosphoethanolamine transferase CptA [candidate division KSB1 bacterium]|nr:phosphoethanolamine transferase CptA [candidate division KSB1 bacterium]MDZ7346496.1 phosphoethanolamine transferase CptA [candidate division KSB1 bacterium]